jgi:sec-independent protein translocase protein TatB
MLNIGPLELILIAVVALVVVGPRRLPEIGRQAGKMIRDLRRMQDEVKDTIRFDLDDEEDEPPTTRVRSSATERRPHRSAVGVADDEDADEDDEPEPEPEPARGPDRAADADGDTAREPVGDRVEDEPAPAPVSASDAARARARAQEAQAASRRDAGPDPDERTDRGSPSSNGSGPAADEGP